ncbi:MAG: ABC transporter permease [Dermatophilaceae bacterium]
MTTHAERLGPGSPSGRLGSGPRRALSPIERLGAVVGHHLTVYRRTWKGSVIERFLSPLFFLLAMGLGLGALVDDRSGGVAGTPYLQFVVPGILAFQAMILAVGESTYPVFAYLKWNEMYAAMLATPLGVRAVLGGHLLVVAGHLTVATTVFVGVAALFGGFVSWWALAAVPVAVLTGMAFAAPVFAFSARLENDNAYGILFRFVVTPLMLFSGTFFPVDQLPVWLQPVAWVTPLWHGVETTRAVALGSWEGWAGVGHVAVLVGYAVVGWVLARAGFERRLRS